MFIGKVVGSVWATVKHPSLVGAKLLLVRKFDTELNELSGNPQMAVDKFICAGIGDTVLVIDEGSSARQILDDNSAPVRTLIIGVLDSVTIQGKTNNYH